MTERRKRSFNLFKRTKLPYYWYIDTTVEGKACKCFVVDGKLTKIDKFNKSIGNFFKTRKEAVVAISKLKSSAKA